MSSESSKRAGPGSGRLRVVLDTNVYVSALNFPRQPIRTIWDQARERKYQLLVSPALVTEIARVLREDFRWEDPRLLLLLKETVRIADIVVPAAVPAVIAQDPDDDQILACAVAGKADLIVSGDRDLLRLKEYENIPIIRPVDFLRALKGL